jgi:A118 family predicted phage portal protein
VPLPVNGTAWPPAPLQRILPDIAVWSAWYAGDTNQLAAVYGGNAASTGNPTGQQFFASDAGGFKATVGRMLARWFWGEPTIGPDRRIKLHVPIAADICQASADLLFAEQITLKANDETTQAYLDDLCDDGLHTSLAEAAEVAAGLGGVYLRVAWDERVSDQAFTSRVDSDQAWPEFVYDRLVAVTFWQVVRKDGDKVWRHLERHELQGKTGVILHGLYEGSNDTLGHVVPLTESSTTAGLAELVDAQSMISTESDGLAVTYVPNQKPQRRWRTDRLGKSLGRSDLDGIESMMDALDETYSSLMRDIRLGKARIMVGRSLLDDQGPGKGSTFNLDREVFTGLNATPGSLANASSMIEAQQFAIRTQEHLDAANDLIRGIARTAGYSASTFGESGDVAATATEVQARQQRSFLTRDRKIRLWRPAIAEHVEKLMAVDQAKFGVKLTMQEPEVLFPDGVQESTLNLAQTAMAMKNAEAASTETLVAMLHPDWDDKQVSDEVALIAGERPAVPDPSQFLPQGAVPQGPPAVGSAGAGQP